MINMRRFSPLIKEIIVDRNREVIRTIGYILFIYPDYEGENIPVPHARN